MTYDSAKQWGEILYKDNSKTIKQTFQNAMDKKQYALFNLDGPGYPMREMLKDAKQVLKERAKKEKEEKKNV